MTETGQISIHSENILPVIKKWLYSEKEIFLRELVANAADAILKLEKIALIEELAKAPDAGRIDITIDEKARTIAIADNGLGMTSDEIKKYINQVAFSGVKDFVEKYQGKEDKDQIIGHFGLGFYSSFMVASQVEIDTLSYKDGSKAAHWTSDGSTEYQMSEGKKETVGTTMTLHIPDEEKELLQEDKLSEILHKYCLFIRYPIYLNGKQVNDPTPLWTKSASSLEEKDYLDFFHKLFPTASDPLFWVHLNVDHPFKLRGVLYFPKLKHELDASNGEVKLFCNQVFVADNSKELIPEFLTLLKGAIDCPDLPLNVSRSYLQNDPQVKMISQHIIKKVADRLTGMAKTEQEQYQKYWDDINPFIKYGMMREPKFYERMEEHLIYKTTKNEFVTLSQYLEKNRDKTEGKIIYASDEVAQGVFVNMLNEHGIDVLLATSIIDQHFLPFMEMQSARKYQFSRVDADVSKHLLDASETSNLVDADGKAPKEKVEELFRKYLDAAKVKVRVESMKTKNAAVLVVDENMRRMREFSKMMNPISQFEATLNDETTLVVNQSAPAIQKLLNLTRSLTNRDEEIKLMVNQIYDLAYLQFGKFDAKSMQSFIERSQQLLEKVGG